MKTNTKTIALVTLTGIFILLLLYCTYNLNRKLNQSSDFIKNTFSEYSESLISNHEFNNTLIGEFRKSPESIYRNVFENGTLTTSGRMCFTMLCKLRKTPENQLKVNNLDEQYMKVISDVYLYYSINLKKLTDYKDISAQQIDSLVNYNNEAIKIVKELQGVK